MKREQRIIYYSDELNDEFAGDNIQAKKIDDEYIYIRGGMAGKILYVLYYRIIAIPLAFFYMKIHFHHRIVNRKVLKQCKEGYFLYGNHTHPVADALIPTMLSHPKRMFVVVHPNNVSMKILGRITPYLGAIPLPDTKKASIHFTEAIHRVIEKRCAVTIYPEAHIWPYYTDIRPFPDTSFRYPAKCKVPTYCFTNTYQKRRFSKTPKIVTYVDGPFYTDDSRSIREQRTMLREQVYGIMKDRAKNNQVEIIRYIKND